MERCGRKIEGLLIDIDGVLHVGGRAVEGAVEAIARLSVPYLYLTNTTTRSSAQLVDQLRDLGFAAQNDQVLSAPGAALSYLTKQGSPPARFVLRQAVLADFGDYPQSTDEPGAVVVGDIEDAWNYELLNQIFSAVGRGAELIALHKNKFWHGPEGLQLDIGAFIAGLEYATGKTATVIGKPNPAFFQAGLDRLGASADQVAMIGDDIDSDVGGAQALGLMGILVKTGKFRPAYAEASAVRPDLIVDSIATL